MARSQRVEVYLPHETVEAIDDQTDNRSAFIRAAVEEYMNE
jgi:metal-responsive CopG/Arc/MetJ family transcriptional regulator